MPLSALASVALYGAYARVVERRRLNELGGGVATASKEAGCGLALGAALFSSTIGMLWLLGLVRVEAGAGWAAAGWALVLACGTAVLEEVLFRGVLFRILEEVFGTWCALGLSAALFGALHGFNPGATWLSSVAVALEAGVLLGAAFVLERRLWLPIGLHAAWNFTEGGIFGTRVSGANTEGLLRTTLHGHSLLSGGAFGPEGSIAAVVVCSSVSVVLLRSARFRVADVTPR